MTTRKHHRESLMTDNRTSPLIGITGFQIALPGRRSRVIAQGQLVSYLKAVARAGGAPVIVPTDLEEKISRAIFERLDGLLLPGGNDVSPDTYGETPHDKLGRVDEALDRTELALARWAVTVDHPLLAICRGIQVLNVALGGTLYQDIPSQLPDALEHHRFRSRGYPPNDRAHDVTVEPGSRLAAALGVTEVTTNSRHHQAIKDTASELTAVAHTSDGLIEGVEIPGARFAVGVQWHPENLVDADPAMHRLFETFVEATRI
jgi:putative glutamine amidotransferase